MTSKIDIPITNKIYRLKSNILSIPVIIRENGWYRGVEYWSKKNYANTSIIECKYENGTNPEKFNRKVKEEGQLRFGEDSSNNLTVVDTDIEYDPSFDTSKITNTIWKIIVDTEDLKHLYSFAKSISNKSQELRVTTWKKRYCLYARFNKDNTWLHSVIMISHLAQKLSCTYEEMLEKFISQNLVVHHKDGVSSNNSKDNLHVMDKTLHDSITHNANLRKEIFTNENYFKHKKNAAFNRYCMDRLNELIYYENYNELINYIITNLRPDLAKDVLENLKQKFQSIDLNVKGRYTPDLSIAYNQHLHQDYLDYFELKFIPRKNPPIIGEQRSF